LQSESGLMFVAIRLLEGRSRFIKPPRGLVPARHRFPRSNDSIAPARKTALDTPKPFLLQTARKPLARCSALSPQESAT